MRPVKVGFCVWLCCLSFFIVLSAQAFCVQENGSLEPGVVVEKVQQHSEAEKAGLQEGDILLRWSRADAHGALRSPFNLSATEIEQAPRGTVQLEGLHGKLARTWQMGQDRWGLEVRPDFPDAILNLYREGQVLATAGKLSEAAEKWRLIIDRQDSSNPPWLRAWLLFHLAGLQTEARNWKESEQAYQHAQQNSSADRDAVVQIHLGEGRAFMLRSDWEHAGDQFNQALVAEQVMGSHSLAVAIVLDELGGLFEKQGDLAKAGGYYQQALRVREDLVPRSLSVAASMNHVGSIAHAQRDLDKAEDVDQRALTLAEQIAPGSIVVAEALGNLGDVAFDRRTLSKAEDYYHRSYNIYEALECGSLDVARALGRLGWVALTSDLTKAEDYFRRALRIQEKVAPDSLDAAESLSSLGTVAFQRGDLAKAEDRQREALTIAERLAPGSVTVFIILNTIGTVAVQRGDLVRAEEYYRHALEIIEKLAPGSVTAAGIRGNVCSILEEKGDLVSAEDCFAKAVAIAEKRTPNSAMAARMLNAIGEAAELRQDFARAEGYYRRALAVSEKLAPGYALDVALSLDNIARTVCRQGDLVGAARYVHQALAISEKSAPSSLQLANSVETLGLVARARGDLVEAEKDYRHALSIREKLAPISGDMALNVTWLAQLLESRGNLDEAEQRYRQALAIWEKLAPSSGYQTEALAGLASIRQRQGILDAAAQFYGQALDALEKQTARLGGSQEVRAGFRANYEKYYRDYISLLLQQGDREKAFQVWERSRARTLLEMLASSYVDIHRGADPALLQRERALRVAVAAKTDRHIRSLTGTADDQYIKAVEKEISDLTNEYQEVEQQLRSRSPAYAALTQPKPLSANAVQQLLPDDTVLLEYSLGESRSYVFAITATSLEAQELPKIGVIEPLARRLYQALTERSRIVKKETVQQRHVRLAKADATAQGAAAELSQMVLGPVVDQLKLKRLLIVGDGALQYVPFAALPIPGSSSRQRVEPLILEHEIAYLPSASVLPLLRQRQEELGTGQGRKEVAVLADPVFYKTDPRVRLNPRSVTVEPGAPVAETEIPERWVRFSDTLARSVEDANLGRRGEFKLPRLAFTRDEAKAIAAVVPPGSGKEALGFEANRSFALGGELKQYRVVHFATHALVDNIHPELSGLVLSLVDRKGRPVDGFLDLEDIYNLDLSADMVVLSACNTALGKELEGEGMIGLARGFMYAGAPRVMATLWNVNDFASAKLMAYFYTAMERDGMKPAEALRHAQLAMWKEHPSSAPYYWVGFVLQGDWK